jgi:hypothetical protein
MLSNPQKALLKRAQREAGLSDDDYRDALQTVTGCRSSTSPTLTDRDMDKLLGYFEAIHWRAADAGTLQPSCSADAVFRKRGYWAAQNTKQETSRDRFTGLNLGRTVADLEREMGAMGYGQGYCATIRKKVAHGRDDAHALHIYMGALQRTLKAKARRKEAAKNLF